METIHTRRYIILHEIAEATSGGDDWKRSQLHWTAVSKGLKSVRQRGGRRAENQTGLGRWYSIFLSHHRVQTVRWVPRVYQVYQGCNGSGEDNQWPMLAGVLRISLDRESQGGAAMLREDADGKYFYIDYLRQQLKQKGTGLFLLWSGKRWGSSIMFSLRHVLWF